jgi:hypothetical protein
MLAGLLVVLVMLLPERAERDEPAALLGRPVSSAYPSEEWFAGFETDMDLVLDPRVAFDPLGSIRIEDVATATVNVEGGRRVSWRAPDCRCQRTTVWMYGGSTAFGIGQRDDHTIASELARLAFDEGVVIDVENRGVVGDTHWEEAQRFAWDLQREPAPDIVVFYDGAGEVHSQSHRGRSDVQPVRPMHLEYWDRFGDSGSRESGRSRFGSKLGESAEPRRSWVDSVRSSFAAGVAVSDELAASAGVEVARYWEPLLITRGAMMDSEPRSAHDDPSGLAARYRSVVADSPGSVVDLSDSLSNLDGQVFSDDTTMNEAGAARVAEMIYFDLRSRFSIPGADLGGAAE